MLMLCPPGDLSALHLRWPNELASFDKGSEIAGARSERTSGLGRSIEQRERRGWALSRRYLAVSGMTAFETETVKTAIPSGDLDSSLSSEAEIHFFLKNCEHPRVALSESAAPAAPAGAVSETRAFCVARWLTEAAPERTRPAISSSLSRFFFRWHRGIAFRHGALNFVIRECVCHHV